MNIVTMSILFGLLGALIVLFIYTASRPTKVDLKERLGAQSTTYGKTQYAYSSSPFGRFYKNKMSRVVTEGFLAKLGGFLGVNIPYLEEQIMVAGLTEKISAMEVVVLKFLGIVALIGTFLIFSVVNSIYVIIIGLFVALSLFLLPQARIKEVLKERNSAIEAALPTFIEQVYICIASGATLQDSLKEVANTTPGELGKAIRGAFVNAAYAGRWSDELVKMAKDLKIEPLEDFVTNIVNADIKGIQIEDTLKHEVEHINKLNRARIMGEVSALESKLSPLQILFCMLPMLGIVMLPILIQILETL